MYSFHDYLRRGELLTHNVLFPRQRKLSTLMLYCTDRCDSRCKHCHIWEKQPKEHLSLDNIKAIMSSNCVTPHTSVGLEGGEFLLHPVADEILTWFDENHPHYHLLSNALRPQKMLEAVQKHHFERLYISLDGGKEAYAHMRGVDGFDQVMETIQLCKDLVPISLMFCLSPYNNYDDLAFCIDYAKKENIDIRVGIYNDMALFHTVDAAHMSEFGFKAVNGFGTLRDVPESVKETDENYDFLRLYKEWRKGDLKLKCQSIFDSVVIHPNGNVPICQNLDEYLGNINEKSLDEILGDKLVYQNQMDHSKNCNKCFINFHRKYDIVMLRSLEKVLPKRLIEWSYGPYQWCSDKKATYKKVMAKEEAEAKEKLASQEESQTK